MIATPTRQRSKRARTGPIHRGSTRIVRGGRTREVRRETAPTRYFVTDEEGKALFDYQARKTLGISGEEFQQRWDAGEFRDIEDMDEAHRVWRLSMLLPFVRPTRV